MDQHRINIMVWMARENGDPRAIEALWDFYSPLFIEIVNEKVAEWGIEDRSRDMIHDCYCLFREVVKEYDFETYCFSYHLRNRVREGLCGVILKNYLPE